MLHNGADYYYQQLVDYTGLRVHVLDDHNFNVMPFVSNQSLGCTIFTELHSINTGCKDGLEHKYISSINSEYSLAYSSLKTKCLSLSTDE